MLDAAPGLGPRGAETDGTPGAGTPQSRRPRRLPKLPRHVPICLLGRAADPHPYPPTAPPIAPLTAKTRRNSPSSSGSRTILAPSLGELSGSS